MSGKTKILALFDFDGTIARGDSTIDFVSRNSGPLKLFAGRLIFLKIIILYFIGLISHHRAKELYLRFFFSGMDTGDFLKRAGEYAKNIIPRKIRKSAFDRIQWHLSMGHEVAVVSGAIEVLLKRWCAENGLGLIATEMNLEGPKIDGRLKSGNCFREAKAQKIRARYDLEKYGYIYAYGDSRGDREMLELADEAFYRIF